MDERAKAEWRRAWRLRVQGLRAAAAGLADKGTLWSPHPSGELLPYRIVAAGPRRIRVVNFDPGNPGRRCYKDVEVEELEDIGGWVFSWLYPGFDPVDAPYGRLYVSQFEAAMALAEYEMSQEPGEEPKAG